MTAQTAHIPRWLSIKQAAAYSNIGRDELKKLVLSRDIRGYKRGKRGDFIIDRFSIDEYHLSQINQPREQALRILQTVSR